MMWNYLSTAVVAVAIVMTQSDGAVVWSPLTSKTGRFTILMPGMVTEKTQIVGQLSVTKFVAEAKGEIACVVSFTDFAESDLKKDVIERRLDQARDGAANSVNGTLKRDKAITLMGHPGRDIAIEKAGANLVRMRIFVVDRRLYQVLMLAPPVVLNSKEADSYLDSFRLIK